MNYQEYLKSEGWQRRRMIRLRLAEWNGYGYCRCEECLEWTWQGKIHVHHRTYERIGMELVGDLAVLCESCHARAHGLPEPGSMADLMRRTLLRFDAAVQSRQRRRVV